jgi:NADH oxidase (H2O2-forming)
MSKIVIIGNGISGVTAARYIRKYSDHEILIISGESDYFFSRTALMYVFMGHMKYEHTQPYEKRFWKKNRIDLLKAWVTEIDYSKKLLFLDSEEKITYDKLIIATGSKPNKFGWKGQDLKGVQGFYSYQDLQELEENTVDAKTAIVVGGGLIGVEVAEMLISRGIKVTFLIRESRFWGNVLPEKSSALIMKHLKAHGLEIILETELDEVLGDESGRVKAIKTKKGEEISCQLLALTAGVSPNVSFLKNTELAINRGVKVNRALETNMPDVYAIGDCAEFESVYNGRREIEQVWYTGKMMGEVVAKSICKERTEYLPGHWFNSAKFFDIEYQTYGWVNSELRSDESAFYWEHSNGEIAVHLIYDKQSKVFKGINTFGIRMRQEVFEKHLDNQAKIETVLAELKDANFDPELYKHYEDEIVRKFNNETGANVKVKSKSWSRILNWSK